MVERWTAKGLQDFINKKSVGKLVKRRALGGANRKTFEDFLGDEDKLQVSIMHYVSLKYPSAICYHPPNEGKRSAFEKYKIKLLGVKAGFPDLLIFYKGKVIAIEIKTEKRRKQKTAISINQEQWILVLNNSGIPTTVVFGYSEAVEFIDANLSNLA